MRSADSRLDRLQRRMERVRDATDKRFADQERVRAELVKVFGERLAQVEANTARIAALEAHVRDDSRHTGKAK